jgi:hypothetical protein
MKNDKENAKNPDWKIPMDLPSVKPEDYTTSDSKRDSANIPKGQTVTSGNDNKDLAKEEQKKRGQLPLHDEAIGGA